MQNCKSKKYKLQRNGCYWCLDGWHISYFQKPKYKPKTLKCHQKVWVFHYKFLKFMHKSNLKSYEPFQPPKYGALMAVFSVRGVLRVGICVQSACNVSSANKQTYLTFQLFSRSSLIASVTQMFWDDILPQILSYLSIYDTWVNK